MKTDKNSSGRLRTIIESLSPGIDNGATPIKRITGEPVHVHAVVIADGHDVLGAVLKVRRVGDSKWNELPFRHQENDVWYGRLNAGEPGIFEYTVEAWVDHFETWRSGLEKKWHAGQNLRVDLMIGGEWISSAAKRATGEHAEFLRDYARRIGGEDGEMSEEERAALSLDEDLRDLMALYPDRSLSSSFEPCRLLHVDREKALFSTWYEIFPRSASGDKALHGTFRNVETHLPRIASMGFDILYFPPIHPVGKIFRKGKNNSLVCSPDDPGSPWAIGSEEGGFKSVYSKLGTMEDFDHLVREAKKYDIEIALDIAFQCSPDHPYVKEHPEWFLKRPDGTIQYAENPPKKYQDIYPFYFETEAWESLWEELKSIFEFWIGHGIRVFRVDNPHTKPFRFWKWLLDDLKRKYPDLIFLSEAFTRPHLMYQLAKLGFTQSYTYFTWRNSKWEFTQYLNELCHTELKEYFRPNFWTNTPDILPGHLQTGLRSAFMIRLILASTMTASYGMYGPAFELMDHVPREEGSEEYLNSEKYEIKSWNLNRADSLAGFISRVNFIRKDNYALQRNDFFAFHQVDNEQLLCYSKRDEEFSSVILVCVNLDPRYKQSGFLDLAFEALGVDPSQPYRLNDLLNGHVYTWEGNHNYIELDPSVTVAHIFRIERNG